jgi:hypothetical protein
LDFFKIMNFLKTEKKIVKQEIFREIEINRETRNIL